MDQGKTVPVHYTSSNNSNNNSISLSIRRMMFPALRFILVLNFVLLLVSSQVSSVSSQVAPVVYDIPRLRPKPPSRPSSRRFRPLHHQTPFLSSSSSSFDAVVPFADEENSGQETRLHEGRGESCCVCVVTRVPHVHCVCVVLSLLRHVLGVKFGRAVRIRCPSLSVFLRKKGKVSCRAVGDCFCPGVFWLGGQ